MPLILQKLRRISASLRMPTFRIDYNFAMCIYDIDQEPDLLKFIQDFELFMLSFKGQLDVLDTENTKNMSNIF